MDGFGASAPADQLMEHFGFTVDQVLVRVRQLLERA
jgi:transketolase